MSSMTKSPFPLLDPIMMGPVIACLNLYLGALLPELYIIAGVAVSTPYSARMSPENYHKLMEFYMEVLILGVIL